MRVNQSFLLWSILWLIISLACDTLEDDIAPASKLVSNNSSDELSTTYTSSGEAILIDLLQGIKASGDIRIVVDKAPTKGEAELLAEGILRYVPYPDFTAGKDWLVVAISSGQLSRKDTIKVAMNLPDTVAVDTLVRDSIDNCTVLLRSDSIVFTNDTTSSSNQAIYYLDVLANDQLCDSSYALSAPRGYPSLTVEDGMIAYHSPDQQDISFSYTVCLLSDGACYEGFVDARFGGSCVPHALYDSVFINHEPLAGVDTIAIDVRNNDQVCDDTPISIYQPPSRGDAWVEDDRIMYAYTINPGDNYGTELKYQYGTVALADSVNRALVSIEVRSK